MVDDAATMRDDRRQKSSRKKPIHFGQGSDEDYLSSEPMRIQLRVYSMEGIRRHDEKSLCTPRSKSRYSNKKNTPKSTSKVPTTALISLRGQVIKTLVPSAPLTFLESRKAEKSARGIAFWQESIIGEETKSKDENPSSTFEISRNMTRQCFHREARIDQMSHFLPERVDLVVGVARGTEILPLGVASVAISGEVEGESIVNIPIQSLLVKTEKTNGKGRPKKGLVFADDSYWYSLDSNAILRVGICVIPRHNYIPKTMEKATPETSPTIKSEENMFIELNDENSLIAHFKAAEQYETTNNTVEPPANYESGCITTRGGHESGWSTMFCGAMGFLSEPTSPITQSTSDKKIMEAKVFSLRNLSDVSGSTMRWQSRPEEKHAI